MRRAILALTLLLPTILSAQPRVGPERQISPPPYGIGFSQQSVGGLAFHSGRGFVLWTDSRSSPRLTAYGSRIDEHGQLLDREGIRVADGITESTVAEGVMWVDGSWTVVFRTEGQVYARRIGDERGELLTPAVPLIHGQYAYIYGGGISVASNGRNFVVLHGSLLNEGVFLVSADLRTIERLDVPAKLPGGSEVVSDGEGYVVSALPPEIPYRYVPWFVRLSGSGELLGTRELPSGGTRIIWTGRDYLLLSNRYGGQLTAQRLSPALEPVGAPFPVSPDAHKVFSVSSASSPLDGSVVVAWVNAPAWDQDGRVYVRTIGPDAQMTQPREILPARYAHATVEIAHQNGEPIAAWTSLEPADNALRLERLAEVEPATAARASRRVETFGTQRRLSASDDLMIYEQFRADGLPEVRIARRGAPARVLYATEGAQLSPAVFAGESGALAVWTQTDARDRRLVAMPLGSDGTPLSTEPATIDILPGFPVHPLELRTEDLDLGQAHAPASAIWTGTHYLVAYRFNSATIRVTRILSDGTVLDAGGREVVALLRQSGQFKPVLARIGTVAVLAWMEGSDISGCQMVCNPPMIVRAARLTLDGQAIDTTGLDIGSVDYSHNPSIAANGDRALLTWSQNGSVGRLIDAAGVVGAAPFSLAPWEYSFPVVAAHRGGYFVAFREGSGVLVTREGAAAAPFRIVPREQHAVGWMAWTTSEGNAALGYRRTSDDTGDVPRLFFREIDVNPRRRAAGR